jgi:streptogramin lyase
MLAYRRPSLLRLFALVFTLAAGITIALGAVLSAAQAAPVGKLTQFKVPTAGSSPEHITQASDGNFWFTESFLNDQNTLPHKVGRITPDGKITEFDVCEHPDFGFEFCFPTDIVQGSDGVLYFTKNDAPLGRITTDGEVLPDAGERFSFNGNGLDAHGDDIWITDFNNDSLWRYNVVSEEFRQFNVPEPSDVAVDGAGIVWFTAPLEPGIGRLDPATGAVTVTRTNLVPRQLTIATDGDIWFSARFTPQGVGRLDPATGAVTEFPLTNVGPEGIAASPATDGDIWFTQTTKGNIARIDPDSGVITEGKVVKGSEPFGITVASNGDPWFTMAGTDKIATFQLR